MEFEWDAAKAASNLVKHGVSFEIVLTFDWTDPVARVDDRQDYGEVRFRTLLIADDGKPYLIVFTPRGESYRIISVRRAHEREYRRWERQLSK